MSINVTLLLGEWFTTALGCLSPIECCIKILEFVYVWNVSLASRVQSVWTYGAVLKSRCNPRKQVCLGMTIGPRYRFYCYMGELFVLYLLSVYYTKYKTTR